MKTKALRKLIRTVMKAAPDHGYPAPPKGFRIKKLRGRKRQKRKLLKVFKWADKQFAKEQKERNNK